MDTTSLWELNFTYLSKLIIVSSKPFYPSNALPIVPLWCVCSSPNFVYKCHDLCCEASHFNSFFDLRDTSLIDNFISNANFSLRIEWTVIFLTADDSDFSFYIWFIDFMRGKCGKNTQSLCKVLCCVFSDTNDELLNSEMPIIECLKIWCDATYKPLQNLFWLKHLLPQIKLVIWPNYIKVAWWKFTITVFSSDQNVLLGNLFSNIVKLCNFGKLFVSKASSCQLSIINYIVFFVKC